MAEADSVESAAPYPRYLDWLRYLSAFLLFTYAASKLLDRQFSLPPEIRWTCPDSQLIRAKKKAIVWQRPRAWEAKFFEKLSRLASRRYLVLAGALRPSAGWDWVALGPPKGHPSATQGPPMGRLREAPLFATKSKKKPGWGEGNRRDRA